MQNAKTNSIVTMAALVVLVLLAALVFGFYKISSFKKESSQLLYEANKNSMEEAILKSVRSAQNKAAEDLEALGNISISEDQVVSVIESLEDAGRALNLETEIASVEEVKTQAFGAETDGLSIVIKSKGNWKNTFSFLRAVESLPHRVSFNSVQFSKPEGLWGLRVELILPLFK